MPEPHKYEMLPFPGLKRTPNREDTDIYPPYVRYSPGIVGGKFSADDTLARGIVRKPPPRTWGLHRYAMLAAFALGAMLAHVGPKAYQQFQLDSVEYVR